jgi:hypothetical protein
MGIPYYRNVKYTDDGCSVYECLACKASWEGRSFPGKFCGNCGVKFSGGIDKPWTRRYTGAHVSEIYERDYATRQAAPMWVLEVMELPEDVSSHEPALSRITEWSVCDEFENRGIPGVTAMDDIRHVLRSLRQWRMLAQIEALESKYNRDGSWKKVFRARKLTKAEADNTRLGYSRISRPYEGFERTEARLRDLEQKLTA